MHASGPILVSGAASGLGKHCCEVFQGVPYTRDTSYAQVMRAAYNQPFRAIIHAAFNTKPYAQPQQLYAYLQDTIFLTQQLLRIPHQLFIFISSVDVYPKTSIVHGEDDIIPLHSIDNFYNAAKLMSESIVCQETENALILRPSAMLGVHAKANSAIKILAQNNPELTLTADSTFNYVRHVDISDFIQGALQEGLRGIYNTCAATSICLREVAALFNRQARFGDFHYETVPVANQKAQAVVPRFKNTSLENLQLYWADINKKQ